MHGQEKRREPWLHHDQPSTWNQHTTHLLECGWQILRHLKMMQSTLDTDDVQRALGKRERTHVTDAVAPWPVVFGHERRRDVHGVDPRKPYPVPRRDSVSTPEALPRFYSRVLDELALAGQTDTVSSSSKARRSELAA